MDEPKELEGGLFEAVVQGSDGYTVRVRVKGSTVTEHVCDCPYDPGPVCKHVVALILCVQNDADLPMGPKAKLPSCST